MRLWARACFDGSACLHPLLEWVWIIFGDIKRSPQVRQVSSNMPLHPLRLIDQPVIPRPLCGFSHDFFFTTMPHAECRDQHSAPGILGNFLRDPESSYAAYLFANCWNYFIAVTPGTNTPCTFIRGAKGARHAVNSQEKQIELKSPRYPQHWSDSSTITMDADAALFCFVLAGGGQGPKRKGNVVAAPVAGPGAPRGRPPEGTLALLRPDFAGFKAIRLVESH